MYDFYFKIGEFAEICGVKKATLVHYAQIGLLPPAHIGENGYYYYDAFQVYDFEAISILRSMSIPLKEIKTFLESRDPESCRVILQKNLDKVREQRRHLEQVELIVENTLQELEQAKQVKLDEIEVVTLREPVRYFVYAMPYRTENYAYEMANVRDIIKYCQQSFSNKSVRVVEVVLQKDIENGSFKKTYGGFFAKEDALISKKNTFYRPAGTYLTMCSVSGGDRIVSVYRRLKKYADEHGYKICGNGYEEDLMSYLVEKNRESYLIRCSLQIETPK